MTEENELLNLIITWIKEGTVEELKGQINQHPGPAASEGGRK